MNNKKVLNAITMPGVEERLNMGFEASQAWSENVILILKVMQCNAAILPDLFRMDLDGCTQMCPNL